MSDQPSGAGRLSGVTLLLILGGGVLLLPGLCALSYAAQSIAAGDFVRLSTRDPYFQIVLVLWGICVVIALGGAFLIWYGLRRHRARQEPRS